MHDCNLSDKAN